MTTNLSINPDEGSSLPLQRWLDVLRDGWRSTAEAVGVHRGESVDAATDMDRSRTVRAADEIRLPWSLDHTDRSELRAALVGEPDRERRIGRPALDAHAAAGELEVQRAAYAGLERVVNDGIDAVRRRLEQVEAADAGAVRDARTAALADARLADARLADARLADARRADAAGDVAATRGAVSRDAIARSATERSDVAVESRSEATAAGIEAATEVARGRDRLVTLRDRALEEARDVTARVNALADDIAAENLRVSDRDRSSARAQARADEVTEARDRRDQAVREIARLTGATATTATEGTVEVVLDGRPVVNRDGAHELAVRLVQEASTHLTSGTVDRPAPAASPDRTTGSDPRDVPSRSGDTPPLRVDTATAPTGDTDPRAADLLGRVVSAPRLTWADDGGVIHPGGQVAAQLDHAGRVLPDALARWEDVGRAVAVTVAAAVAAESAPVSGSPRTGADGDASRSVQASGAAARATLDDVAAALVGRAQIAERRLDVMSVVDAVLVGAPISQIGGLVSTALGGRTEGLASGGYPGQQLVSALQAVDAVTSTMGRTAETVAAELTRIPLVLESSDPARVQVTPLPGLGLTSMSATPPGTPPTGSSADLSAALLGRAEPALPDSTAPTFPTPMPGDGIVEAAGAAPSTGASALPSAGFEAAVTVASLARPAVYASMASFDPAARFEQPFAIGFGVITGPAEPPTRTIVAVRAGAGIEDVVTAINASSVAISADTAAVAEGAVRLLLTSERTGSEVVIRAGDGHLPGRPSDIVGGFVRIQRGADTVVQVTPEDGESVTATSSSAEVDDAVPGLRLVVGADPATTAQQPAGFFSLTSLPSALGAPLAPVRISARPDAAIAAAHASSLVAGAAAVIDTIHGRNVVAAPAASTLAQDPVVAAVATRLSTALTGHSGGDQLPDRSGRHPGGALPGVRIDAEDRLRFDPRVFQQAFAEDSVRVSAQLRALADDLVRIAADATDPRSGALAVRILGEQNFAQEYSESAGDVDDRTTYRQDVLEGRAAAMTSLLERLGDEQRWLDQHAQ